MTFKEKSEIYKNSGYDTSLTLCFWMLAAIGYMIEIAIIWKVMEWIL